MIAPDEEDPLFTRCAVHDPAHRSPGIGEPVLSIRAIVPVAEVPSFTRDALREVRLYVEDLDGRVEGPPFSIHHAESATHVDLEVGWPTRLPSAGRIHAGTLPSCLVRHDGGHHAVA